MNGAHVHLRGAHTRARAHTIAGERGNARVHEDLVNSFSSSPSGLSCEIARNSDEGKNRTPSIAIASRARFSDSRVRAGALPPRRAANEFDSFEVSDERASVIGLKSTRAPTDSPTPYFVVLVVVHILRADGDADDVAPAITTCPVGAY